MVYARKKNTTKIRSLPSIALKASDETGGLYFNLLYWKDNVYIHLGRVNDLSQSNRGLDKLFTNEYQTTIENRQPIFEWSTGNEIIDEEIFISDNNQIL